MSEPAALKTTYAVDDTPKPKIFHEKIGNQEFELEEVKLDVFDHVNLWDQNPRIVPDIVGGVESEEQLESHLKLSRGYDALARSISEMGQMEAVYVWKRDDMKKYVVLEGASRVTILRELARKKKGGPEEAKWRQVKAKVLPAHFGLEERIILLAKIHVRGTGVRPWGRHIEAKFVYDAVTGADGKSPSISVKDLAGYMGKSPSWVSRLKDAYEFARKFIEKVDSDDAEKIAIREFSTLEEISKCAVIGSKLKAYDDSTYDELRSDVFDMVTKEVFKEYRDARFMKQFHDDPEKWAILKQGEKHSAHQLANDLRAGATSLKAKVEALPGQIERAFEKNEQALTEDDVELLRKAVVTADSFVNAGVPKFRIELARFTKALESVSLADVRTVTPDDLEQFNDALGDFLARHKKHTKWE
jgi:hypothetical protein